MLYGICLLAKKKVVCYLFSESIDFTSEHLIVNPVRIVSEQGNRDDPMAADNSNSL